MKNIKQIARHVCWKTTNKQIFKWRLRSSRYLVVEQQQAAVHFHQVDIHVVAEGSPLAVEGSLLAVEGSPLAVDGSLLAVEGSPLVEDGSPLAVDGYLLVEEGSLLAVEGFLLLADVRQVEEVDILAGAEPFLSVSLSDTNSNLSKSQHLSKIA